VAQNGEVNTNDQEFVFKAQARATISEQLGLSFATTGPQGGNYTHSAEAVLELVIDGGYHAVFVEVDGEERFELQAGDSRKALRASPLVVIEKMVPSQRHTVPSVPRCTSLTAA
jgi:hypothetical protein